MTRRTQQMGEFLREEVTDIIRSELDDPRLGFWTVTRVEVPSDMRSAQVYISVLGSEQERKETLVALRGAAGFIRGHLRPRMRTRMIPDLDFRDDRSMEHAEEIDRALRELKGVQGVKGAPLRSGGAGERTDGISPSPPAPPSPPTEGEA